MEVTSCMLSPESRCTCSLSPLGDAEHAVRLEVWLPAQSVGWSSGWMSFTIAVCSPVTAAAPVVPLPGSTES
ncbi:hypothetical protein E2C01_066828 [Portunus trituberculatus]|uniref:Uncharacterized protein n=1 Tax=Portunus trituberculatus TaxID=210409 RepID=A0A5B7HUX0_PORTR|nr:hypothetical protein [Portunus trituberculatus]